LLVLILAEAALETVPKKLWSHSAIRRHAKKQKKQPGQLILDRTLHHSAMKTLKDNLKRGRPDIVHFALLAAMGSPLNRTGLLRTYVHTCRDYVIELEPCTRLPKNYNLFVGLMEQLLLQGKVPVEGEPLLMLEPKKLDKLLAEVQADYVLVFSRRGEPETVEDAVLSLKQKKRPAVIIGGFPHGDFGEETLQLADEVVSVDFEALEAWTVTSRVVYEYERLLSLPTKRLQLH